MIAKCSLGCNYVALVILIAQCIHVGFDDDSQSNNFIPLPGRNCVLGPGLLGVANAHSA